MARAEIVREHSPEMSARSRDEGVESAREMGPAAVREQPAAHQLVVGVREEPTALLVLDVGADLTNLLGGAVAVEVVVLRLEHLADGQLLVLLLDLARLLALHGPAAELGLRKCDDSFEKLIMETSNDQQSSTNRAKSLPTQIVYNRNYRFFNLGIILHV